MNITLDLNAVPPAIGRGEIPAWLTEKTEGREDHISDDLYRVFYWQEAGKLIDCEKKSIPLDTPVEQWLAHVLSQLPPDEQDVIKQNIAAEAVSRIPACADDLSDTFQRIEMKGLWLVHKRQLWRFSRAEYDSFEEWLLDSVPRLKEGGNRTKAELSQTLFILSDLLPVFDRLGGDFEPDALLAMKENWSKARESVSYLRMAVDRFNTSTDEVNLRINARQELLSKRLEELEEAPHNSSEAAKIRKQIEQGEKEMQALLNERRAVETTAQDKFEAAIENMVEVISNRNIPVTGPTGVKEKLFALDRGSDVKAFPGLEAQLISGETLFLFRVPANASRAITSALRNIVDFKMQDPELVYAELHKTVYPGRHTEDKKKQKLRKGRQGGK